MNLLSLPNDCLRLVVGKISCRDLSACACVSHAWKQCFSKESFWEIVFKRFPEHLEYLDLYARAFRFENWKILQCYAIRINRYYQVALRILGFYSSQSYHDKVLFFHWAANLHFAYRFSIIPWRYIVKTPNLEPSDTHFLMNNVRNSMLENKLSHLKFSSISMPCPLMKLTFSASARPRSFSLPIFVYREEQTYYGFTRESISLDVRKHALLLAIFARVHDQGAEVIIPEDLKQELREEALFFSQPDPNSLARWAVKMLVDREIDLFFNQFAKTIM